MSTESWRQLLRASAFRASAPRASAFRAIARSTQDDGRKHYLDTVPDDSLQTVLRYLSCRPQHQNWHAYITPYLVQNVLDVGGALAHAASLEFHSIGGKHGIHIDIAVDTWVLRILAHRLPLRRLVLKLPREELLPELLRGCGAELREIDLDAEDTVVTETDVFAISTNCTNLSSLAIRGNYVESTLTSIWRSLGSTLTQVYIGCNYSAVGYGMLRVISVPDMVEHCVNLRRVDVEKLNDATADILVALGGRIRVLSVGEQVVDGLAPWQKVYRACTNLEAIHLELTCSEQAIQVLSLMPTKLISLTLHNVQVMENQHDLGEPFFLNGLPGLNGLNHVLLNEDHFASVVSACSALKQVELSLPMSMSRALVCKLFECMKLVTTMTCDVGVSGGETRKDVVDMIGRNLTNLESLTMSTRTPLKGKDVDALVDLLHLKYVKLQHRLLSEDRVVEKRAVEVLKRLKDCAQLLQIDIAGAVLKNKSQRIAEAVAMYGRRDVDLFIAGVPYRTW